MRSNAAVLWSSKAFKVIIADSTCHAETAEMSRATKSTMFVRMVLTGIGRHVNGPTTILGDNRATDILVTKEGSSSRSRHFELATVFVKYAVMRLFVTCRLVLTTCMIADVFTKATDEATFFRMRAALKNGTAPQEEGMLAKARRVYASLGRLLGR